jgi:hypothetical protein
MIINIRDRVQEFKKLPARDLLDNAGNWRTHPAMQRDALVGVLNEIGMVNALVAYHSERNGGKLTLIDGHLRKEIDPNQEWWIAITDLTDAEADLLLVVFDPLSAMAERDDAKIAELAERVQAEDLAVQAMVRRVIEGSELADEDDASEAEDAESANSVPAMNLQPFEHYDYIVLIFRNTFDWTRALELFGLETKRVGIGRGRSKKVGLSRVVEGAQFLDRLTRVPGANE